MRKIFLYMILIFLFPSKLFSQINKEKNNLYGEWKIFKVISANYNIPEVSKEDIDFRINRTAIFTKEAIYDSIYASQNYIYKDPNITINKESAAKYFKQDSTACKWAGYKYTDSIWIVKTNGEVPFKEFILFNKNTIILRFDGFYLFMKKEKIKKKNEPVAGDTVRCYLGNKCGYTGYVIQGTRKKGHVIHVNPVNKNVPMEKVDEKYKKDEEEKKE